MARGRPQSMDCGLPAEPTSQARRRRQPHEADHPQRSGETQRLLPRLHEPAGIARSEQSRRRPCHTAECRDLFGGVERPGWLGHGLRFDLQAATGLRAHRSRPRPVLARRHRKRSGSGDAATFQDRPLGADGSPGRGQPDLDRRGGKLPHDDRSSVRHVRSATA